LKYQETARRCNVDKICRAILVYLLVLLMVSGCGTGAATRGSTGAVASGTEAAASGETGAASSETGTPTPGAGTAGQEGDGTTQVITFKTEPPGAQIVIDGKDNLTSPAEVRLTTAQKHSYEISKDAYEKVTGTIDSVRDQKERSKVPGIIGGLVAAVLVGAAMGALAGVARVPTPIFLPGPAVGSSHPGYTYGPPRLEPTKVEVELAPMSP
jgi:hypothetical protein